MHAQFVREMAETTDEKKTKELAEKSWLESWNKNPVVCKNRQFERTMWQEKWNNISYSERMWKVGTKGVQEKSRCCKNSSLEIVWEIQPKKKWKWYEHAPEDVVENEVKIFRNVMIQCDREIEARKPDIAVVKKNERSYAIIDITIPSDIRVSEKEKVKIEW